MLGRARPTRSYLFICAFNLHVLGPPPCAGQRTPLEDRRRLFSRGPAAQDAVALALTFDRSLATTVAARPEDDEALQRKLWLAIARHLIAAAAAAPDADAVPALPPGPAPACVVTTPRAWLRARHAAALRVTPRHLPCDLLPTRPRGPWPAGRLLLTLGHIAFAQGSPCRAAAAAAMAPGARERQLSRPGRGRRRARAWRR